MGLETATYIGSLNSANPLGSDNKAQGDDHLRLIKSTILNSFAGFTGPVVVYGTEAQGSTVNDYTVAISPAPAAYVTGMIVLAAATHANTGAATLQVNALGTKTLHGYDASSLVTGDIPSGGLIAAIYDGTQFKLLASTGKTYLASVYATLASPALTGTPTAPTAATGTSSTQIATTAFVAATAFSSALPAQTGNGGNYITTDGATASWTPIPAASLYAFNNFT